MFINYSAESGDTTLGKLADLLKGRPIGSVFLLQNNGKQYVRHSMISRRTFIQRRISVSLIFRLTIMLASSAW